MTLRFRNLTKRYGQNVAIDDVTLTFEPGLIYGVIGPNGAGKSTLINMTAGSYPVSSGRIELDGRRLDGLKKHEISLAGVARTYQNIRLFDQMTALENLEVCLYPVDAGRPGRRSCGPPPRGAVGGGVSTRAWRNSTAWTSRPTGIGRRPACPTAGSGCSRSPGPWSANPGSCCSTSLRPA